MSPYSFLSIIVLLYASATASAAVTANSAISAQIPSRGQVQFLQGTDVAGTYKVLYTAGVSGSVCKALWTDNNDASATHLITIQVLNSGIKYGGVALMSAVNAGSVDIPPQAIMPSWAGLPLDQNGNPYLILISGDTIQATFATALTAAARINIHAMCADFASAAITNSTLSYNLVTGTCTKSPTGTCNALSALAISGGSTTVNNAALAAFNQEAQRHTRPATTGWANGGSDVNNATAGDGNAYADADPTNQIVLYIPGGTYQYTNAFWGHSIANLRVFGDGSDLTTGSPTNLQNTNNDGPLTTFEMPWAAQSDFFVKCTSPGCAGQANNLGWFINSIGVGATSATLSGSPANASAFIPGRWILIASYDQQMTGYPPNFRFYDWAKVLTANASTGVVTWDTPTQFAHIGLPSSFSSSSVTRPYCAAVSGCGTGWPSTLTDGPTGTPGPARLIPIDTPEFPITSSLEVDGLHVLANPNWSAGSPCTVLGVSTTVNICNEDGWQFVGTIDTVVNDLHADADINSGQNRRLTISNSRWGIQEADKVIGAYTMNNDVVTIGEISHAGELLWQVNGGTIPATDQLQARNIVYASGVVINGLTRACAGFIKGVELGNDVFYTQSVSIDSATFTGNSQGCQTNNGPINAPARTGTPTQTVDGTHVQVVTGPNGAGTRLKMLASDLAVFGTAAYRAVTNYGEGSTIWRNGVQTAGVITSITGDGSFVYVDVLGTTFATSDTYWGAAVENLTVTNNVGSGTGYNWPVDCGIRYPAGTSIPNVTCSSNSGN